MGEILFVKVVRIFIKKKNDEDCLRISNLRMRDEKAVGTCRFYDTIYDRLSKRFVYNQLTFR